jgi:hypothetical protein
MSKMQRSKGQRGEREFFGLLSEQLGTCVRRNVDQARNGGADGIEVPGWAVEVKRQESGFQSAWWAQALRQADAADACPALAYRASRQSWRVRVLLCDAVEIMSRLDGGDACGLAWMQVGCGLAWVEMDVPTFALIVRESVPIVQAA